jgi:hypothetical protein
MPLLARQLGVAMTAMWNRSDARSRPVPDF